MTGASTSLFVLGFHRGGTTYVQRLLNTHPQVQIWGENGGLVSNLRRAYAQAGRVQHFETPPNELFDSHGWFEPWASPFDRAALLGSFRSLLSGLYERGDATYWGFKEIRHGTAADLSFLRSVFPECRVVGVVRHPRDLLMSELRVLWGPAPAQVDEPRFVERFLFRYRRTVAAFLDAARRDPELTYVAPYEDLQDAAQIQALFVWLGLDLGDEGAKLIDKVRRTKIGSSYGDSERPLSPALIAGAGERFTAAVPGFLESLRPALREPLLTWYPDLGQL